VKRGSVSEPAREILDWYDRHRRDLPWRAGPGERAEPYHVWLSEIMLQQTTVKAVRPYFARFLARWPRVEDLAAAPREDVLGAWAGLGYYARARNLHACAKVVAEAHGGEFPDTEAGLRALPGVGDYTAAAIAAIAFGRAAAVVDGNVERVMARRMALETPLPAAKKPIRAAVAQEVPAARPGDFAQAMMDLGATICTPKNPACALCPWQARCAAHKAGTMLAFPVKAPRRAKPVRYGHAFVVVDGRGAVLLGQRPDKGLLGGMSEVPGGPWRTAEKGGDPEGGDMAAALADAATRYGPVLEAATFQRLGGAVSHVFTHFELRLTVHRARLKGAGPKAVPGSWWAPQGELTDQALPSVMAKVLAHASVGAG